MMKYLFLLAIFSCVCAEMCLRLLKNNEETKIIRRMPRNVSRWNRLTGKFEQFEALKLNNSALCSVDATNDLHGKIIIVAATRMNPYIIEKPDNIGVTGFIGDIWAILEKTLRFKTIYRRPGQTPVQTLMNGDTHALLVATAMYSYTSSYYTYSTPFTSNSYALFVQPIDVEFSKWWYINIFSHDLKLMYLVSVLCIVCIIMGIYRIKKYIYINYKECDDELSSLSFNILYVLGGTIGQGIPKIPRSWCFRLIVLSYLIMGILLSCGFSSTLTSYLTTKGNSLPLANLEDVARKKTHSLCVRNDSSAYRHFTIDRTAQGNLKATWKGLVNEACPDMRNRTILHLQLCHPGFVYLEVPDVFLPVYRRAQHNCRIVQIPGAYGSYQLAFLHARTSQYRHLIDIYLMRLRSAGIFRYLEKKWIRKDISDSQYNDSQWSILQSVEYVHIYLIFLGFLILMAISVLICVLENIWFKLQSKSKIMNPGTILLGTHNNGLNLMKTYRKSGLNVIRSRKISPIFLSENIKKQEFLENVTIRMRRWQSRM